MTFIAEQEQMRVIDSVGAFMSIEQTGLKLNNRPDAPLAGLTFAVKDLLDVEGHLTGGGNPDILEQAVPAKQNNPLVEQLLVNGAEFIGKTVSDEVAFSLIGNNAHYGAPLNMAAPDRFTGGSSSGSAAAVAAGLVDVAIGTDTMGSIRGPASWCGLVGLRPTHGRVDMSGTQPLAPSLDTLSWFTRDIETYRKVAHVALDVDAQHFDFSRLLFIDGADQLIADEELRASYNRLIEGLVQHLSELGVERVSIDFDLWQGVITRCQAYEAWQAHGEWIQNAKPKFGSGIIERFEVGRDVSIGEYQELSEKRAELAASLDEVLGRDAIAILPSMASIAPKRDASEDELLNIRKNCLKLTGLSSLAGVPQVSLPLMRHEGCPFGVGIMGPKGSDRKLLDFAQRLHTLLIEDGSV